MPLSRPGNTITVAAPGQGAAPFRELLAQTEDEQGKAAWRTILVYSDGGPFDVELKWSAGGAAGFSAVATLSRGGQLAVFARSLGVRARNRWSSAQKITVGVADGQAASDNAYEYDVEFGDTTEQEFAVPAFARSVSIGTDGNANAITVRHYINTTVKETYTADLRRDGSYLGGTTKVTVTAPNGQAYRVIFHLTI